MAISAPQAAPTYQAPPAQLLAGSTPTAEAEAPASQAAAVNPGQQMYDSLKADLENQGPVGGSRSFKTRRNGDVVIINAPRSILPKTGIKTVDKVSKEITPTVENTRTMVEEVVNNTTRASIYGGITGAIIGVMMNLTRTVTAPNKANFGRMGIFAASLGVVGAAMSGLFEGYKAYRKESKKVTSSAMEALKGMRKNPAPESK